MGTYDRSVLRVCNYCRRNFYTITTPPSDYCSDECARVGRMTIHQRCAAECFFCTHTEGARHDVLPGCYRDRSPTRK